MLGLSNFYELRAAFCRGREINGSNLEPHGRLQWDRLVVNGRS